MDPAIETLIVKFLSNEADRDDLLVLEKWIKEEGNATLLSGYIKVNMVTNKMFNKYDRENAKQYILRHIEEEKRLQRAKRRNSVLKYAAILILALGLGYMLVDPYGTELDQTVEPIIVDNQIETGTDKATLTLEDGSQVALGQGTTYERANATSNGEEIVYSQTTAPETSINTLTVPRGGQFFIELSDGTKVWLNAESQLKYPVSFIEGKTRQVELVYGEGYFEVSPSERHGGSHFLVDHKDQKIEVLGTQFNLNAYGDENRTLTTLVEGKVSVTIQGDTEVLIPGEQAVWDGQHLTIAQVDVYDEVSWKNGIFSFDRKTLGGIMRVLSRWYDMEVVFEDPELARQGFTGVLGREQEITEILDNIKAFKVIENYEIKNKTIILK